MMNKIIANIRKGGKAYSYLIAIVASLRLLLRCSRISHLRRLGMSLWTLIMPITAKPVKLLPGIVGMRLLR